MSNSNSGRAQHRSVTDRGSSRRYDSAQNHLSARACGPKSKAQKRQEAFERNGIPLSFANKQPQQPIG